MLKLQILTGCRGLIMTFGAILAYYTDFLLPTTPKYLLTLVGTIPPFLLLALALFWGRLLDAGHRRKLNIIAAVCLIGGLVGLGFTGGNGDMGDGKYWAILLAAIPMGIGESIYFLAAPHMAKTWFPNNKGFAMGITNGGAALGGITWPFVFTSLTGAVDYRLGVGALAAISFVMSTFIACASMPAPEFVPRSVGEVRKVSTWIPTRAFRSRTFLVHIAAMCSIYLGILTIPFLIEVWAQKRHLGMPENADESGNPIHFDGDNDLTVYIVVAMNAGQLPGRLLGSTICDYISARKAHAVACIVAIIEVALAWNLANNYIGACTFASFFGLTLGIMVSLPINDAQEILGTRRTHLLGQYAGTVYTCSSPFILAGGIVTGALVDRYHIKSAGIWACVTLGLGFILIMVSLMIEDDTWKFDEDSLPETEEKVGGADDQVDREKARTNCEAARQRSMEDAMTDTNY
jgi:Major Facilitator Superfamily